MTARDGGRFRVGICPRQPRSVVALDDPVVGRSYSITSSALTNSPPGTVRPGALAVLRSISSLNLAGCCAADSCDEIAASHLAPRD